MSESARFGPPWATTAVFAAFFTLLVYAGLSLIFDDGFVVGRYPFGFALLVVGLGVVARSLGPARGIEVDAHGVTSLETKVHIPWSSVEEVRVDETEYQARQSRMVTLGGGAHGEIQFVPAWGLTPRASISRVDNAAALLAVVADRTGSRALFPPDWESAAADPLEPDPAASSRPRGAGLVALAFKVGPKIGKMALALLKTIKPGAAVLALGAYSLVFSWKFAVVLLLHILVHELGHVFAMFRSGVPVKGVYLIPFFGGAAVSKGVAKTRWNSAYIALMGPVWGAAFSGGLAAAFFVLAGEYPFLAAAAAWGALINLFNLFPIFPLDGGRILGSLTLSSSRGIGIPIMFGSLALGLGLAYVAQLELLVLMVLLGFFELTLLLGARSLRPALALMQRPLSSEHVAHFYRLLFPQSGKAKERRVKQQVVAYERQLQEARQSPMTKTQGLWVLAGYLAVVGSLVVILYVTSGVEGGGNPIDLLS